MSHTLIYDRHPGMVQTSVVAIQGSLLTAEEISRMSVFQVEAPLSKKEVELIADLHKKNQQHLIPYSHPIPADPTSHDKPMRLVQQLTHSSMGSTSYTDKCSTCNGINASCPDHSGDHIPAWPVSHIGFSGRIYKIISQVCFFCSRFLNASLDGLPDSFENAEKQRERFWKLASKTTKSSSSADKKHAKETCCDHCHMPQPTYSLNKDNVSVTWPNIYPSTWVPNLKLARHLSAIIQSVLLEKKPQQTCYSTETNDFQQEGCASLNQLVTHLLTLPLEAIGSEERWLLNVLAFLIPAYRCRLFAQPFTYAKASDIFIHMRNEDLCRMGISPLYNPPRALVLTDIPIAGNALRPVIAESSGTESIRQDGMTTRYNDIVSQSAKARLARNLMAIRVYEQLDRRIQQGTLPKEVLSVLTSNETWMMTDMRSCWFNFDVACGQHVSDMQHEMSCLVDQKAVPDKKADKGHNSNKEGAKNAQAQYDDSPNDFYGDFAAPNAAVDEPQPIEEAPKPSKPKKTNSKKTSATQAPSIQIVTSPTSWYQEEVDCIHIPVSCFCNTCHLLNQVVTSEQTEVELDEVEVSQRTSFHHVLLSRLWRSVKSIPWIFIDEYGNEQPEEPPRTVMDAQKKQPVMIVETKLIPPVNIDDADLPDFKCALPKHTVSPYTAKRPKSLSLADKYKGKNGRFRNNVTGKRSNFTGRYVLTPADGIHVNSIGISAKSCLTQTRPIKVTDANKACLAQLVANGSGTFEGAEKIITGKGEGCIINIPKCRLGRNGQVIPWKDPRRVFLQVGWFVYIYLRDGDYVIVNRQPSLQKASHNAHRSKRTRGKCISANACNLEAYNGDFDGDTVAVTFPQTQAARITAAFLFNVPGNMICPRAHKPIVALHQDSLHGAFLLTKDDTWLSLDEAQAIMEAIELVTPFRQSRIKYLGFKEANKKAYDPYMTSYLSPMDEVSGKAFSDKVWCLPEPARMNPDNPGEPQWLGRQLFALILPSDLVYTKACGDLEKDWPASRFQTYDAFFKHCVEDKKGRFVYINNGQWICGNGSGEVFGKSQRSIIHHLWRYYGRQYACDVLSDWANMAELYLKNRGFTCGVADVMLGGIPNEAFREVMLADESLFPIEGGLTESEKQIKYQYALLKWKDAAFAKLDDAYNQVNAFMANNIIHLRVDDIEEVYSALEEYAKKMFLYMGDFTNATTDESTNGVVLMKSSGSKGSTANTTTMAAALNLEGFNGPDPIGAHIKPDTRVMSSERYGERSLDSLGFVRHGFVEGHSVDEMMKHGAVSWDKVYRASRPEKVGYQQRRISAMSESETIQYDGTVRNGSNEIVQLKYGGDGYDCLKVQNVYLHPRVLNPQSSEWLDKRTMPCKSLEWEGTHLHVTEASFNEITKLEANNQTKSFNTIDWYVFVEQWIHREWLYWFACDVNACPHCESDLAERRHGIDVFLRERACRAQCEWKTVEELRQVGIDVLLTLRADDVCRNHATGWKTSFVERIKDVALAMVETHHIVDFESFMAALEPIKAACAQHVVTHDVHLIELRHLCKALLQRMAPRVVPIDLIIHVRHALCYSSQESPFLFATRFELKVLFQDVYRIVSESMMEAASAVGVLTSQSISQPMTQLTLRAFKFDTGGSKQISHMTVGVTRQEDLMSNKTSQVESLTCAFSPVWVRTMEDAEFAVSQLVSRNLLTWMCQVSTLWLRTDDCDSSNTPLIDQRLTPSHPLYTMLSFAFKASYAEFGHSLPKRQAFSLFQLKHEVSNDEYQRGTSTWRHRLNAHLNGLLLPFQRGMIIGGPSVDSDAPYWWCMWHIHGSDDLVWLNQGCYTDEVTGYQQTASNRQWHAHFRNMTTTAIAMMTQLKISGYEGIDRCLAIQPPKTPLTDAEIRMVESGYLDVLPNNCFLAMMQGVNFADMLDHPACMDQYCHTSNVQAIKALFDIDANQQCLAFEFDAVLGSDSTTYVQARHTQLLADTMTSAGFVTPINRAGLAMKDNTEIISEMAFENTPAVILSAGMDGRTDSMSQAAANLTFGNKLPFTGSGIVSVMPTIPKGGYTPEQLTTSVDFNLDPSCQSISELVDSYISHVEAISAL
jgi:DNA-directed RNA polymerase beta' subunit